MGDIPSGKSFKVGERIRQIRKAKKLSMKDLAKQVGVSFSYIAKIETGQNRLNVEMLYGIAQALRVSLDSLLSPQEEESKIKTRGFYTLKDFFVVRYDSKGRPEQAYYEIHNPEANVIGQLRDLDEKYPEIAQAVFKKFEEFARRKDLSVFREWFSNGQIPFPPPKKKAPIGKRGKEDFSIDRRKKKSSNS